MRPECYLGRDISNSTHFNGELDSFSIFLRTLSASQIQGIISKSPAGPSDYFLSTRSSNFFEKMVSYREATVGASQVSPGNYRSYQMSSIKIQYFKIEHLTLNDPFTIAFHARTPPFPNPAYPRRVLSCSNASSSSEVNIEFYCGNQAAQTGYLRYYIMQSSVNILTSDIPQSFANQWSHYVWTRSSSGFNSVYKDGVLTTASTAPLTAEIVDACYFGNVNENNSYPFAGTLEDFRVYRRLLNSSEVAQIHQQQQSCLCHPSLFYFQVSLAQFKCVFCSNCIRPQAETASTCPPGQVFRPNYFLREIGIAGVCTAACSNNFYHNTSYQACEACQRDCQTCHLPFRHDLCITCSASAPVKKEVRYEDLPLGQCVASCPKGYYVNGTSKICMKCHSTCASCSETREADNCNACTAGTAHSHLRLLTNTSLTGFCLADCQPGYYASHIAAGLYYKCFKCAATCVQCATYGTSGCTACDEADPLTSVLQLQFNQTIQGWCQPACSPGSYLFQLASAQRVCYYCHWQCLDCRSYSNSSCLSCEPTSLEYSHLQPATNSTTADGVCRPGCQQAYYPFRVNGSWVCFQCSPACLTCAGYSNLLCTSCDPSQPNNHLQPQSGNQTLGQCRPDCLPGYREIARANNFFACVKCHETCQDCFSWESSACLRCDRAQLHPYLQPLTGSQQQGGYCRATCDSGYFPQLAEDTYTCKNCHEACAECVMDSDGSCTNCFQPNVLLVSPGAAGVVGRCVASAPKGYGVLKDSELQSLKVYKACHASCTTCRYGEEESGCSACRNRSLFVQALHLASGPFGSCVAQCAAGFYGETIAGRCQPCNESCLTCKDNAQAHSCTSCHKGNATHPRLCLQIWQANASTGTCQSECSQLHYAELTEKNGIASYVCVPCSRLCKTCAGATESDCLSCAHDLLLQAEAEGSPRGWCQPGCNMDYYEGAGSRACRKCDASCLRCRGAGPSNCTRCRGEERLQLVGRGSVAGSCVTSCAEDSVLLLSSVRQQNQRKCVACDPAAGNLSSKEPLTYQISLAASHLPQIAVRIRFTEPLHAEALSHLLAPDGEAVQVAFQGLQISRDYVLRR